MLEVSCRDLGITDCDYSAAADSVKKLESRMLEHARDEHPELIAGITAEEHEALIRRIAEAAHLRTAA
jgi:predicted small metal-binding protein